MFLHISYIFRNISSWFIIIFLLFLHIPVNDDEKVALCIGLCLSLSLAPSRGDPLYIAFLAQARYLGSNVEVEINFDNAFLVQARYLSSNVEVKIFCRPPTPIHRSVCFYVLRFMRFEGTRAF